MGERAGDRVHAAGVVRRRSSASAGERRTVHRCSSAARSASGSPARRRPSGRWCRMRTAAAGRARRRLDARDARPLPHLLPGDLRRHGGAPLPQRALDRDPGRGGDERRAGRARRRHRPAVARLLRDGRPPGVDGGPQALRQPRPPRDRTSRRGWPSARPPRSSSWPAAFRIPHAPIGNGATIPGTDHFEARGSIVTNPSGDFVEPGPPYRFDPPLCDSRRRQLGARHRAERSAGSERRPAPTAADGLRVLDLTAFWAGPALHPRAGDARGRGRSTSSRRPGPTAPGCWPASASPSPTGGSGPGSSPGSTPTSRASRSTSRTERGRELLRDLIATCDVLVENYTPRVLEQIGLDVDAVRADPSRSHRRAHARLRSRRARGATTRPSPSSSRTRPASRG